MEGPWCRFRREARAVSDIDTASMEGLKALDPKQPIREADMLAICRLTGTGFIGTAMAPPAIERVYCEREVAREPSGISGSWCCASWGCSLRLHSPVPLRIRRAPNPGPPMLASARHSAR